MKGVRTGIGPALAAAILLAGCATAPKKEADEGWGIPYPPRGTPAAEEIQHVPTGLPLSFGAMMDVVSGARIVYVGETHDNIHAHRVQLLILRELFRMSPGKVALGMEMFREPQQPILDRWTKGELTELEFIKASKWYDGWGSDFGYYRDLLAFARENGIDVVALNPSRELQEEVSRAGMDNVSESLRAKLPEMGEPDPYQKRMLREMYGGHVPSGGMFDAFARVQFLWEETMAARIVEYLKSPRGDGKRMVVLAGGVHVRYGFGIPKKVLRRLAAPYVIVAPEEISVPPEKQEEMMDVTLSAIPLHPADFLWFVPYEDLEKEKVRLGVRLEEKEGAVRIASVEDDSPAAKAGIPAGGTFVSFDGEPVADTVDVIHRVRAKKAGDRATVVVRKDGFETSHDVTFFVMAKKAH